MTEITEDKKSPKVRNRRVHMANERTFLAWIRTSIAIMAFGIVIERFAFFLKQMLYISGKTAVGETASSSDFIYSSILGIILVLLGALMGALSFIRYKKVERQINEDTYRPSPILNALLVISVLVIAALLVIYLIHSL